MDQRETCPDRAAHALGDTQESCWFFNGSFYSSLYTSLPLLVSSLALPIPVLVFLSDLSQPMRRCAGGGVSISWMIMYVDIDFIQKANALFAKLSV